MTLYVHLVGSAQTLVKSHIHFGVYKFPVQLLALLLYMPAVIWTLHLILDVFVNQKDQVLNSFSEANVSITKEHLPLYLFH